MPITVEEKWESRSGKRDATDLIYIVRGTDDDQAADAALFAALPATYGGLVLSDYPARERIAQEIWLYKCPYGAVDVPKTSDKIIQGSTGGGTAHITQSLETVGAFPATGLSANTTDFGGAIGVTPDAVEGVDIIVPAFRFSVTKYVPVASVVSTYFDTIYALTGTVNGASFAPHTLMRTFAAGELLLEGVDFSQRNQDDWEFVYHFAASPNIADLDLPLIPNIVKAGHNYVWFRYLDVDNDDIDQLVKKPVAAYVERVYRTGDFSGLGL